MTYVIIAWAFAFIVVLCVGWLKKHDKINYYLADFLWVICCIVLAPLMIAWAFMKTSWKIILHGIYGLEND